MKRCLQSNRVETDEALKVCSADGATLINDSLSFGSETTCWMNATDDD